MGILRLGILEEDLKEMLLKFFVDTVVDLLKFVLLLLGTPIKPLPNESFEQTEKRNAGFSGFLFLGQIFCGVIEFGIFIPQMKFPIPFRHVTDELFAGFNR